MKNLNLSLVMLAVTALALTACGGGGASYRTTAEPAAAAMDMGAGAAYEEKGATGYYAEAAVQETAAAMDSGEPGGITDTTPLTAPAPQGRKLIRTVDLTVETTDFQPLVTQITDRTAALGGYIEQSSIDGGSLSPANQSIPKYAQMTVRIPSNQLNAFLKEVETAGNVTNRSDSTTDVTLQYSDIESRKKTLAVEQDRLWALLEKADSLDSVIILEERLTEIRYELESYETQLKSYDNQVDYSTVTMSIREVLNLSPVEPESTGTLIKKRFSENLGLVTGGISNFFIWLITSSPLLIFLGGIAAVIILIVRKVIKKSTAIINQKKKGEEEKE